MHNVPKKSDTVLRSCSKCCKICKVCLTVLRRYTLKGWWSPPISQCFTILSQQTCWTTGFSRKGFTNSCLLVFTSVWNQCCLETAHWLFLSLAQWNLVRIKKRLIKTKIFAQKCFLGPKRCFLHVLKNLCH